jgi:pyruvate formate lyase activating enzyme
MLVALGRNRRKSELAEAIANRVAPAAAELSVVLEGTLRCIACAHRCAFEGDRVGACGVRESRGGSMVAPFGYVARRYVRNVETNTVYHVEPGALALTFGMYGCDLRCPYCHNWKLSQALREDTAGNVPIDLEAGALVDEAVARGCRVICAAYNEPMIAAEWVRAVFEIAKDRGLRTMVVSDGNTTREALAYLRPVTDVYRVDLKGWDSAQYKTLGGRIEPVLAAISDARELGYWVEVVTLVVPNFNDDPAGLRGLAKTLAAIDVEMPWHLNAFQPRYKMKDRPAMTADLLVSIAGAAYARGLRYVYVGNVTSAFSGLEHTRCPSCHSMVIERRNYATLACHLGPGGACPKCATKIPGLYS